MAPGCGYRQCHLRLFRGQYRRAQCPQCAGQSLLDIDLDSQAFPYMGVREGTVAGIAARVIRVGFVGELGYEVHMPQHCGEALWDALIEAGAEFDIKPFGIEAQRILRLEKGHIIIGQDTDAMSNPTEVNMGWAIAKKKPFFVGGRSIQELEQNATQALSGGLCG